MYHLSPYTYIVEALMGNGKLSFFTRPLSTAVHSSWMRYLGLGGQQITCSEVEYSTINPPAGLTCSQYMDPYMSRAGGYLTNPDSTSACQFCSFRNTDEFLDLSFNIKYSNRWRDIGIFIAFIVFNVRRPDFLTCMVSWANVDRFSGCYDLSLYVLIPHEAVG